LMKNRVIPILLSAFVFLFSGSQNAYSVELKVLSGNGSRPAVIEICKLFEAQTGYQVKVEFAVNPHVRERVDGGEYVDVVVLNPPVLDQLINSQKVTASSKTPFGRIGVGAAIAGLAGSFYPSFVGTLVPDSFAVVESFTYLAMVIVGGMGTMIGPVIGSIVLTLLPEVLRDIGDARLLVYGITLTLVILFMPGGIVQGFKSLINKKTSTTSSSN